MKPKRNAPPSDHPQPTMYFVGVTTGGSSINQIFPRWMAILGLEDARLVGVDLPIGAAAERYRQVVMQIKHDPLTLGALVTTHKIDLFNAARDLFDEFDIYARLGGEVSCIYKRADRLIGAAVDPVTAGLSIRQFVREDYWTKTGAQVMCIGAGGAGVAITAHFLTRVPPDLQPTLIRLIDRSQQRLDHLGGIIEQLDATGTQVELILSEGAAHNDRLLAELPPGSLVINATGMGKDIPGSPITDQACFPEDGIMWELNYRGERNFMKQALRQASKRHLRVEDGWHYFLLGWTTIIGQVFDVSITTALYNQLAEAAGEFRPPH